MSVFLLYHPKTRTTGRALANAMGVRSGTFGRRCENISHIIRWGNIREISHTYRKPDGGYTLRSEINNRLQVELAGSKLRSLQKLRAAGVPVPEFLNLKGDEVKIGWGHPTSGVEPLVLFGRKYRHTGGEDIQIFVCEHDDYSWYLDMNPDSPDWVNRPDYLVEYIEPHTEYRIHVMADTWWNPTHSIVLAQKKYFGQELHDRLADDIRSQFGEDAVKTWEERGEYIRNNNHGWRFYDVQSLSNVPTAVQNAAIRAVNALGLHFGAVDVISYGRDEKGLRRAAVLEINTAPGLRDRSLAIYAERLKLICEGGK